MRHHDLAQPSLSDPEDALLWNLRRHVHRRLQNLPQSLRSRSPLYHLLLAWILCFAREPALLQRLGPLHHQDLCDVDRGAGVRQPLL